MASSQTKTTQTSSGADDAGTEQVQKRADEVNQKGYIGTRPDGPPNESYTLAGVTKSSK